METWGIAVAIAGLSVLSGLADAHGFVQASRMWHNDRVYWPAALGSAGGFAVGIGLYWVVVRLMLRIGIQAADLQTVIWFAATVAGVALATGRFARWPLGDQMVAAAVVAGLGWLLARSGHS